MITEEKKEAMVRKRLEIEDFHVFLIFTMIRSLRSSGFSDNNNNNNNGAIRPQFSIIQGYECLYRPK